MNEISSRIAGLIARQLNGDLNEQERQELESWAQESDIYRNILERFTNEKLLFNAVRNSYKNEEQILNQIKERMLADQETSAKVVGMRRYIWVKITAAATVVILLSIGAFIWFTGKQHKEVVVAAKQTNPSNDIAPGKDGAILKLADGKEIVLDNSANGNLARQGSSTVIKQGTELRYNNDGGSEVLYNTLSTPHGRQFQLVLPDGSRVWLNSASSITFPTAFTGKYREVIIQGEVYMEVEKDGSHPFKVSTNEMQVEVLGTHFNINSYGEEAVTKITLLEGKVKVRSVATNAQALLSPGEQAQMNRQNQSISKIRDVDVDAEVAWRYGYFQFNNSDLKSVMRQLARWYDIEVVYKGAVTDLEFLGKIPRSMSLSQVLTILEKQDVHFRIDGKTIVVSP